MAWSGRQCWCIVAGAMFGGAVAVAAPRGAACGGSPIAVALVSAQASADDRPMRAVLAFARDRNASRRAPAGVVLEGIVLPASAGPEARQGLSDRLDGLAGAAVTVYGGRVRLDRRDRVAGQAAVAGADGRAVWLQAALVEEGLAVVDDVAGPCATALLAAEAAARSAGRGVFAAPGIAVDAGKPLSVGLPGFVMLEGRVLSVGNTAGTTYLNFGTDRRTDATARMPRRNSADFTVEKDLSALVGAQIRIRGWANARDGLDLAIEGPDAIETIEERRDIRRGQ